MTRQYIQKGDGFVIVIDNHIVNKSVEGLEEKKFWINEPAFLE